MAITVGIDGIHAECYAKSMGWSMVEFRARSYAVWTCGIPGGEYMKPYSIFSWWDDHHDRNNRSNPNFTMAHIYIYLITKNMSNICVYIYIHVNYIKLYIYVIYYMYTQGNIYIYMYIMTFYPHYCWLHRHSERWYNTCKTMTIETLLIVSNFPADGD